MIYDLTIYDLTISETRDVDSSYREGQKKEPFDQRTALFCLLATKIT